MDKNNNYKQKINDYLILIYQNLLGIPNNHKRQYLNELGKGLEQEYIDFIKLNSNQNEFFSALDDPKQVAKEFLQSMNLKPHLWTKLTSLFIRFELFVNSHLILRAIVSVFLFSVIPFLISIVTSDTVITFQNLSISVTGYYPNQTSAEGYNLFSFLSPYVTLFFILAFSIRLLVFYNIKKILAFVFIQEVLFYLIPRRLLYGSNHYFDYAFWFR